MAISPPPPFIFQETLSHYILSVILSFREGVTDSGVKFLDLKVGDLMSHDIMRIETKQVRLVGIYAQTT